MNLPGWDDLSLNTFEIVSEWFNEHSGWLLIFDNADDIDLFFGNPTEMSRQKQMHEYIPRCEDGTTIITTRDKRVAYRLSDREDPILVAPMNEKDAGALLRSRTAQQGYFPANSTDDAQLLEALGNIPLAITQAAAFITENNITVAEYLQILHTNQAEVEDLLSEELGDQRRYSESASSILNTLKLSFDQIIAKKPLAADILSLMAFLDRNGIPKTLLQRDNIRNIDFVSALGTLQNFSLIGAQRGGADFEMHRLVQLSLQRWLRGSREKWQCEVIAVLSQRFPVGDYVNWKECEKLSPHAQTVLAYTDASEQGTLQRAQILYNLARFDGEQSRYQMAEQRFAEAVKMRQEVLGVDNPETLKSMSYLGEVLFREGKYSEAGSVLRTVIAENTKRLGPEAEETLYNTGSLAEVVQGEGKFSEAEELFRTALKGEGRCLGDVHVMKIADSLGAVLRDQKKFNDSEYWIRKSLAGRERLLGNDHLETLRSVNHLALLLSMMGRLEEAEQMARRAVSGSEAAMGRDHHLTFMSVHTHGKILRLQGRYDAATEQCRRALDGFIKVLGPENRGTLRCLQSLAFIEEAQGSYSEAERLLQQVVDGNIKTLGSDHQHTLDSVNDLKRVSTLYNRQKSQPSND